MRAYGIYVVPVGELENFIKEVEGYIPNWINRVLEAYPNLSAEVYAQIRQFVAGMNL